MRIKQFVIYVLLFTLFALLSGCAAATSDDAAKLPITTASEKARELYLQGRDLQEKLRALEARPYFQKAVAEDPDFAIGHFSLAFTSTSTKEFFASLETAVSLADAVSEGERWWILGAKAGTDGNPVKQRELFQKLAEKYPNDERCQNILGGHYFGQQQYNYAIEQYEKAIKINPEFSQPYNQLGYAYRFLEKYEDSERTFKKYIEVIPDDPNPYDSYAELLLKIGKFDASIENYRKALAIDPSFAASYTGIATDYNYKGEHANARKELQKLYGSAQNDGQRRAAHFATTVSYVHEGNLEMALKEQEKMYDLASKINDAAAMSGDLATMGNILLQFGKPDAAFKKYHKSLKIMQESDHSKEQKDLAERFHHSNLAQVALKKHDLAKAKKHANEFKVQAEAAKNRFQIWLAHQLAGMIALEEKDYEKAVTELEQTNKQNPYNLYRLAMAYEGKGEPYKARAMFEKAANFNGLNSMNQAFVKIKSQKMMSKKS
jgi:tetratricopeptide (TPR) repeat protein